MLSIISPKLHPLKLYHISWSEMQLEIFLNHNV